MTRRWAGRVLRVACRCVALAAVLTSGLPGANAAWGDSFIQLAWDDCYFNGASSCAHFGCDTNQGSHRLVVSFTMPQDLEGFIAIDGAIDLWFWDSATVPEWWHLRNAGTCRQSAATASNGIHSLPGGGAGCEDIWDGGTYAQVLFTGYAVSFGLPNRARAVFALNRSSLGGTDLVQGTTYFGWIWTLTHERTVGADACGGCDEFARIWVSSIIISGPSPPAVVLQGLPYEAPDVTLPLSETVDWVGKCEPVPAARTTWGTVKALYR